MMRYRVTTKIGGQYSFTTLYADSAKVALSRAMLVFQWTEGLPEDVVPETISLNLVYRCERCKVDEEDPLKDGLCRRCEERARPKPEAVVIAMQEPGTPS